MIPLLESIKKDFKILFRSKLASFIVIASPLLLIFLIGFAYNAPETYRLNIGVYAESESPLTDSIIRSMKDSTFNIITYNSRSKCIQNIKLGIQNACVLFPENMSLKSEHTDVKIVVDTSKTNIAWIVKDIVENKIKKKSVAISENITNNMIEQIVFVENESFKIKKTLADADKTSKELTETVKELKEKIQGFNTSYDFRSMKANETKKRAELAKTNINNLKIDVNELLDTIDEQFNKIDTAFGNSTSEVKNTVKDAKSKINAAASLVSNSTELSRGNIIKLEELVNNIHGKINEIESWNSRNEIARRKALTLTGSALGYGKNISRYVNALKSSNSLILKSFNRIEIRKPGEIAQPIKVSVDTVTPARSHMSIIFPQFLAVMLIFIGLLIPTIMRVHDKSSRAFVRQKLSPVYNSTFIFGTYLTNLIIILFQFLVVLGIAKFVLNLGLVGSFWTLLLSVVVISSSFIMVGMFIGQLFREEQSATIASMSLLALLLFFSGIIIPLESLPPSLFTVNYYNPFVMSISLLRANIFFGTPFMMLGNLYLIMIAYAAVFYILTLLLTDFRH